MASLALPGMSGFASEIAVFVGMTTTDIYSSTFRTVTVFLSAVGVILTPIYLLSMLRQVFYGSGADQMCDVMPSCELSDVNLKAQGNDEAACFGNNCDLPVDAKFEDANPREIFIAACFLSLIVAFGFYPKLATQMYDVKTVALNAQMRESYRQIAETNPQIYADVWNSQTADSKPAPVLGLLK